MLLDHARRYVVGQRAIIRRGHVTDQERALTQAIIMLEAIERRFCASEPRCPHCGLLRGPQFSGWLLLDHARIYLTASSPWREPGPSSRN